MSFEDRIRRARPSSGHRHLPLTPRAERDLKELLDGTTTTADGETRPQGHVPHEPASVAASTMVPLRHDGRGERPARAHRALMALVACVALAIGLPLGILLWPGEEDAVPPAVPGPATSEPAPSDQPADEPDAEPTDQPSGSADSAAPDERLTELPAGGTERVADSELPGQDRTSHFTNADRVADIVMVDHDDLLHVRAVPGPEGEVVGELPADGHVVLAGRERALGLEDGEAWSPEESVWAEIRLDDGYGWVHTYYLGYLGYVDEDPAVVDDVPPATDPAQIAASVGTRVASSWERPEGGAATPALGEPGWSVVHAEHDGGRAHYWVDVTGMADDSGRGSRYQLTLLDTGQGWEIDEAVAIAICRRGASDDSGYCQ